MRALVQTEYGEPEAVLSVREVARPSGSDDDVLVRVRAISVNIGESHLSRGVPKAMRPIFGLRRPRAAIPGEDIAGVVESVGASVTGLRPGDEVFGSCRAACAEYAVAAADKLAPKPDGLDFAGAAALGVSAQTALQALRDHLRVEPGHTVLVVGASGGVGSFAVQIAKAMGAEVTGVCSTRNVDMVRSLGADHVIDYRTQDYITAGARYDRILDNVAAHPMAQVRRLLTADGRLLSNGAPVSGWFGGLGNVAKALAASTVNKQQARPFVSITTGADSRALGEMVEAGTLRPVIDRTFTLEQGPQAFAHVAAGHAQGKTIIAI
jgi:NADPH:quinone reductase-like Zn-dependent oxidoreductase